MKELIISIVWGIVTYLLAKELKEKHEGINITPINYLFGGFLFGVISVIWCGCKCYLYTKKHK